MKTQIDIQNLTLDDLIKEYQIFLKDNLNGNDISEISFRIKKTTMTISNYLNPVPDEKTKKLKAVEYLTMKAIVEIGLEILNKKGITKTSLNIN